MTNFRWMFSLALMLAAPAANAQPATAVSRAIAAGQAGERYDGYMAVVGTAPADVRRQVAAINLHRRNLYLELASRRNVTADVVAFATACELLGQLPVGGAYMLKDGVWRRRAAGQPAPIPDYCR